MHYKRIKMKLIIYFSLYQKNNVKVTREKIRIEFCAYCKYSSKMTARKRHFQTSKSLRIYIKNIALYVKKNSSGCKKIIPT